MGPVSLSVPNALNISGSNDQDEDNDEKPYQTLSFWGLTK
jgi:hypothetical protein